MRVKRKKAARQLLLVDQRKRLWVCACCLLVSKARSRCGRCGTERWASKQMWDAERREAG